MSDKQVIYEVGMRDGLTGPLTTANTAANKLEGSLGSVKGLIAGMGAAFAGFKIYEYIGQANEAWDKMEFSISQVQTAIKSTGGAAGLSFDELKKGAEETAHELKYTQAEILGMQSVLLTFPSVTKETFAQASTIIADMSTRLGQDLKSSTIQLGKALQDPERGITALRKVGVNFNETQVETIKTMVKVGDAAGAQALILKELAFEFGGSARAAAEADKSFRLDKTMEENKVALGEVLDQIKEQFLPTLVKVAEAFKTGIEWIGRNKNGLENLAVAVGVAVLAFKAMVIIPPLLLAIENAMVAAATGTATFGASMTAALGPIGLLTAAIGLLVYAYMDLNDQEAQHEASMAKLNQSVIDGETNTINTIADGLVKRGMLQREALEEAKKFEIESLQSSMAMNAERVKNAVDTQEKIKWLNIGYGLIDQMKAAQSFNTGGLVPTKAAKKLAAAPTEPIKEKGQKATGSKNVTINVTIKDLIGTYNSNVTNVKNMAADVRQQVVAALTSAVNDFQIVADRS